MQEPSLTKRRIGEILLESELITPADLATAIKEQKRTKKRMGEVLVDLKFVSEFDIANTLASQLGIDYISLETATIEPNAIAAVPENVAVKSVCIPIECNKNQLVIAMADPLDYGCLKDISFLSNCEPKPLISTRSEILSAIKRHYNLDDSLEEILHDSEKTQSNVVEIVPTLAPSPAAGSEDLKEKSEKAPIIRLFNLIFSKAMRTRTSDIHIDAQRYSILVRFRIDGILQGEMALPKWVQGALVSRIKILAALDISERRLPQDGAIRARISDRDVDLRVSTLPTQYGEKVVIRVLDQNAVPTELENVGVSETDHEKLSKFVSRKQGILLVTGPTGSGKTSTLYALINKVRSPRINMMTVEDPIEYNMEEVNQIQVKPEIGMTFANALRSILRQDPNVIMVGEIRDLETAEIAFRAAITGHLVISTLHTNDAISTITRLVDMGIPRYLVASSVIGVVAQRLVRKICEHCKVEVPFEDGGADRAHDAESSKQPKKTFMGKGCKQCNQSGYYGRTGLFEILTFDAKVKEAISGDRSEEEIRQIAETQGFTTMGEDGLKKVFSGMTTLEEVHRVIDVEEEIQTLCPQCRMPIHLDFVACPHCKFDVKLNCGGCKKRLKPDWKICPYCKTDV